MKNKKKSIRLIEFINSRLKSISSNYHFEGTFEKHDKYVEICDETGGVYIDFYLKEFCVDKIQEEFDHYKNPDNTVDYINLDLYYKLIEEVEPILKEYKELEIKINELFK